MPAVTAGARRGGTQSLDHFSTLRPPMRRGDSNAADYLMAVESITDTVEREPARKLGPAYRGGSSAMVPRCSRIGSILWRLCQKSAHKSPFSLSRLKRFFTLNFSGFRVGRNSLISTGVDRGAFGNARTV